MTHIRYTKKTISAIIFAAAFVFVPAVLQITQENTSKWWLNFQQETRFFEYHAVVPQKSSFNIGEQVALISYLDISKPVDFKWVDILRCDFNDGQGFQYISDYVSYGPESRIGEEKVAPWEYQGRLPEKEAVCYIESNIEAHVGFGITKSQKILSDEFQIK